MGVNTKRNNYKKNVCRYLCGLANRKRKVEREQRNLFFVIGFIELSTFSNYVNAEPITKCKT